MGLDSRGKLDLISGPSSQQVLNVHKNDIVVTDDDLVGTIDKNS